MSYFVACLHNSSTTHTTRSPAVAYFPLAQQAPHRDFGQNGKRTTTTTTAKRWTRNQGGDYLINESGFQDTLTLGKKKAKAGLLTLEFNPGIGSCNTGDCGNPNFRQIFIKIFQILTLGNDAEITQFIYVKGRLYVRQVFMRTGSYSYCIQRHGTWERTVFPCPSNPEIIHKYVQSKCQY